MQEDPLNLGVEHQPGQHSEALSQNKKKERVNSLPEKKIIPQFFGAQLREILSFLTYSFYFFFCPPPSFLFFFFF